MARPLRSTEEEFYDVFASWPADDQAIALRVMEQIHRIAKRAGKKPEAPEPADEHLSLKEGA